METLTYRFLGDIRKNMVSPSECGMQKKNAFHKTEVFYNLIMINI